MGLSLSDFSRLLDDAISVAKSDTATKKKHLDLLFNSMSYGKDQELKPVCPLSNGDADGLLAKLATLTEVEKKDSYGKLPQLREDRLKAIASVRQWLKEKGQQACGSVFANVAFARVALQVGLRIRRPRSVNQGPQGFCGPASILVPVIRTRPGDFVSFVTALMDNGQASFGSRTVTVVNCTDYLQGWGADRGPEVDYVALGSLRADVEAVVSAISGDGLAFDFLNETSHATTPAQIAQFLTHAGYQSVQNCTLMDYKTLRDNKGTSEAGTSLKACSTYLGNHPGGVIVMLVHPDLALAAKRKRDLSPVAPVAKLADAHWILVKRLTIEGENINTPVIAGKVKLKLYTWKWTGVVEFALADFLPRYFGYVCALPA